MELGPPEHQTRIAAQQPGHTVSGATCAASAVGPARGSGMVSVDCENSLLGSNCARRAFFFNSSSASLSSDATLSPSISRDATSRRSLYFESSATKIVLFQDLEECDEIKAPSKLAGECRRDLEASFEISPLLRTPSDASSADTRRGESSPSSLDDPGSFRRSFTRRVSSLCEAADSPVSISEVQGLLVPKLSWQSGIEAGDEPELVATRAGVVKSFSLQEARRLSSFAQRCASHHSVWQDGVPPTADVQQDYQG